jgi:hypothetical protein
MNVTENLKPEEVLEPETELKVVYWVGGDAPNREAALSLTRTEGPVSMRFMALYEPGYCGCPDRRPVVGFGSSEAGAVTDYWEKWEEKHGDGRTI